jgi:prepilin-type processing-associated H-X9-DG protein
MYLLKYGDNSYYAIPVDPSSAEFRGDCWVATLYWTGIVQEPKVFLCPATDDGDTLPATQPATLNAAAVDAGACSYTGLRGGGGTGHQKTLYFTETTCSSSAMSSDDNEGSENHSDGMNVVYFDTHVNFVAGDSADTYDRLGLSTDEKYGYLDSGG